MDSLAAVWEILVVVFVLMLLLAFVAWLTRP